MSHEEASNVVSIQYTLASIGHELNVARRHLKRGRTARALGRLRDARRQILAEITAIDDALADATPYDAAPAIPARRVSR